MIDPSLETASRSSRNGSSLKTASKWSRSSESGIGSYKSQWKNPLSLFLPKPNRSVAGISEVSDSRSFEPFISETRRKRCVVRARSIRGAMLVFHCSTTNNDGTAIVAISSGGCLDILEFEFFFNIVKKNVENELIFKNAK